MAPSQLLGSTDLWRPVAAARGGGWATAAVLLLLLASHLAVLLVRLRRRLRGGGRNAHPEAAVAPAPASTPPGSASASGIEGLVTEGDLRQLVGSLGLGAHEPEREGWEHVISKSSDDVSYKAWCDKPTAGPPKYLSITTYERCSAEQLRDFYMDNEYRMEWDNTVKKHEQLQYDENSGVEVGRTIKKFPLLTPREYILAWRVWEANDKSFYCFIKECEHPLAARQRKFVRVQLLRSGWCIRKIPGRDACQITVLHHEDNGMNIEMAKLAFSKGIWSYICKMNNALRRYPQHGSPSVSILTMQKLMKKDLETADASLSASQNTAASVVPSTPTSRTSPCKLEGRKSRQMIASGILLVGSIVCLSRGRSNLGAQLAMAFFLKKAFKQERQSSSSST
ncbi:membrane related protein-like isoform X1 [Zea mays]|uniref:membrane related protein-like isoform X1 n=1 Tax=Zea mays TaxID=4577 RepID=UPI0004DE944B|nr:membrane related protein-like isoform X1 [Zea mays]|eukprot:XP_008643790.1 membrane related protein-like isoform X1 [Zea mays]